MAVRRELAQKLVESRVHKGIMSRIKHLYLGMLQETGAKLFAKPARNHHGEKREKRASLLECGGPERTRISDLYRVKVAL